ncbi:MAG: hypothetical protein HYW37_00735 [Candidatus Colwellbacteria bacterium]|nr:hypothetical protein [Candidatus Colwellbacteria bacterium]
MPLIVIQKSPDLGFIARVSSNVLLEGRGLTEDSAVGNLLMVHGRKFDILLCWSQDEHTEEYRARNPRPTLGIQL